MVTTGKLQKNGKVKQFLNEVLQGFREQGIESRVRARSTLVGISATGPKLVGYQNEKNEVVWTSKNQYADTYKVEAGLDDNGNMEVAAFIGDQLQGEPLQMEGIFSMEEGVLVSGLNMERNVETNWKMTGDSIERLV